MEITPAPARHTLTRATAGSHADSDSSSHANRKNGAATTRAVDKAKLAQEQAAVQKLASRDREVRAHEQAHASVGGSHAGHPNYQFTSGPNGVRYASGGHVDIDISKVKGDPQATVEKMQQVQRAALAPASPSAQDRAVASKATAQAAEARAEVQRSKADERVQENTDKPVEEKNSAQEREAAAASAKAAKPTEFGSTSGSVIDTTV